jgi:hypothetical protein
MNLSFGRHNDTKTSIKWQQNLTQYIAVDFLRTFCTFIKGGLVDLRFSLRFDLRFCAPGPIGTTNKRLSQGNAIPGCLVTIQPPKCRSIER